MSKSWYFWGQSTHSGKAQAVVGLRFPSKFDTMLRGKDYHGHNDLC